MKILKQYENFNEGLSRDDWKDIMKFTIKEYNPGRYIIYILVENDNMNQFNQHHDELINIGIPLIKKYITDVKFEQDEPYLFSDGYRACCGMNFITKDINTMENTFDIDGWN